MSGADSIKRMFFIPIRGQTRAKRECPEKVASPVGEKAVQLIAPSSLIFHRQLVVGIIERTIQRLEERYQRPFKHRYLERWRQREICRELGLSKSTYYRMRNCLAVRVAQALGWADLD